MKNNRRLKKRILCNLLLMPLLVSCESNSSNSIVNKTSDCYIITLDYADSASRNGTLYVAKGSSVTLPSDPKRNGFSFAGWKDGNGNSVDLNYTPTADVKLIAQWSVGTCSVTFHANYEGGKDEVISVEFGKTVTTAPVITRPGYVLRYWATIEDGTEIDLSTYTITGDFEFYAIWRSEEVSEYTVTITAGEYDGAPEATVLTLESGETIKKSNAAWKVTRQGYDLAGWTIATPSDGKTWTIDDYDNKASLIPSLIKIPYKPTSSCTIYAVWTIQKYTIVWNANYTDSTYTNGVFKSDSIFSSETVTEPSDVPVRENYTFTGWYNSALGGTKMDFTTGVKVDANTGYYAHWKHKGVSTRRFQAEYVEFEPNKEYFGYSGSVRGTKAIIKDGGTVGTVDVDNYPTNSKLSAGNGYYVSYQYEKDDTLSFNFTSDSATTATLVANLCVEYTGGFDFTSAEGDHSVLFKVNGVSLNYSISLTTQFQVVTIGNINLQQGDNKIEIVVNNSKSPSGGTYKAAGFNTDYIELTNTTANTTWSPIYDNLENV